jgi:hypothetical protein
MLRTLRLLGGMAVLALPLLACNLSAPPAEVQATATPAELTLEPTESPTPSITPLVVPSTTVTPTSGITPIVTLTPTQPTSDPVNDWPGAIVRNGAGVAQPLSFQVWQGTQRFGVTSTDQAILSQLYSLADNPPGVPVHVWGTLYYNAPGQQDDVIYVSALNYQRPVTITPTRIPCTLPVRLAVGASGRVSSGPLPNAMRSAPGTGSNSTVLGNIPSGTIFSVLEGPVCASGYNWWKVNASGFVGWTAEGQNGQYWLDPLSCANGMQTRLTPGQTGRVTFDPPLPNSLRSQPNGSSTLIAEIPAGGVFTVLAGPQCGNNRAWWQVNYNGLVGWTSEGDNGVYWLEPAPADGTEQINDWRVAIVRNGAGLPYPLAAQTWEGMMRRNISSGDAGILAQLNTLADMSPGVPVHIWGVIYRNGPGPDDDVLFVTSLQVEQPQPTPVCGLAARLQVGYSGQVTPGLPNSVRTAPGTGGGSTVIGNLPENSLFRVAGGPICADGLLWWEIDAPGVSGWTAEGQNNTYWLSPVVCSNGMHSRLISGQQARVAPTPPVANSLRAQASSSSALLTEIPPGDVFTVIGGPTCGTDGRTWWQVNYNGTVGWTAEGDNGVYWLEPLS